MRRLALVASAALIFGVAASASAQLDGLGDLLGPPKKRGESAAKPRIEVRLAPADAKPGQEVTLSVKIALPADSYTYPQNPSFGKPTTIRLQELHGLEPIEDGFRPDREPKIVSAPPELGDVKQLEKFYGGVTFSRRFRIAADASPADVSVRGSIALQYCDASTCRDFDAPFEARLIAADEAIPAAPSRASGSESSEQGVFHKEVRVSKRGRDQHISFVFDLSPPDAKPGETVTLAITARPDEGYHIFAQSQNPDNAGLPTVLEVTPVGLEAVDDQFTAERPFKVERLEELGGLEQRVFYGEVTWSRRFRVSDDATSGYGVRGSVRYQICREGTCLLPTTVSFSLGHADVAVPPAPPTPPAPPAPPKGGNSAVSETPSAIEPLPTDEATTAGLIPFLITAVLAGFAALLTPCVFPMVPITVSFFLKQAEKEHHKPISTAVIYCLGIVATFTALGLLMAALFGATSINRLANNGWLNLAIAAVLVFFGFNLLGLFEIRIPSWLLSWSSGKESRGGVIGTLFMALTFTLTSFTCTFAFVGFLIVLAAKGEFYWPVLGLTAFSAAFALPFFFLAVFPSYLQSLPKAGGWMNTIKVTMGLVEIGAALKFLSVTDLAWNPQPAIFDYALVMTSWTILCAVIGFYLLGTFRLPHDTPVETISVGRLTAAVGFLGLAAYLSVGLYAAQRPTGKLWEQIEAFAPPRFSGGRDQDLGPVRIGEHDNLKYALDFERALEYAKAQNRPLFLDFTGVNCVNCRLMEKRMASEEIRRRLERFVLVQLYTDNVPFVSDRAEVERLLERNRRQQEEWFEDVSLPSYAIVTPDGRLLEKVIGVQPEDVFVRFLDSGLSQWEQIARASRNGRVARN